MQRLFGFESRIDAQPFESELANHFSASDASPSASSESSGGAREGDGSGADTEDASLVRAAARRLEALLPAAPQDVLPTATREPQRGTDGSGTTRLEDVAAPGAVGGDTAAATSNDPTESHNEPSNANTGEGEEPPRSALAATASSGGLKLLSSSRKRKVAVPRKVISSTLSWRSIDEERDSDSKWDGFRQQLRHWSAITTCA